MMMMMMMMIIIIKIIIIKRYILHVAGSNNVKYRVIHKSNRDFRTRLRNNQDRHGRKEHINK